MIPARSSRRAGTPLLLRLPWLAQRVHPGRIRGEMGGAWSSPVIRVFPRWLSGDFAARAWPASSNRLEQVSWAATAGPFCPDFWGGRVQFHGQRTENRLASSIFKSNKNMAPQVGLEPTTLRLTAGCSAIELLRSVLRQTARQIVVVL